MIHTHHTMICTYHTYHTMICTYHTIPTCLFRGSEPGHRHTSNIADIAHEAVAQKSIQPELLNVRHFFPGTEDSNFPPKPAKISRYDVLVLLYNVLGHKGDFLSFVSISMTATFWVRPKSMPCMLLLSLNPNP